MKKKILGIVLCLAMIIGMFPMGVKAAELPATVTITINLDEFKYYKAGVSEADAFKSCHYNEGYYGADNIEYYTSLDDRSKEFYTLLDFGLYQKDSDGTYKSVEGSEGNLDTNKEYYVIFRVRNTAKDSVPNTLDNNPVITGIKADIGNGTVNDAIPIKNPNGGTSCDWYIPLGKPGIPVTDVDVIPGINMEVRYNREIPDISALQVGYTDPRYKLTSWQWTKEGNPVTESTFTEGIYSFTAVYTINTNTSGEYICKFKEDDSNSGSFSSLKVNGHECGKETKISDDGHTLTLIHTLPEVTAPIKDIEFTMGELTYLLDNGGYTEGDLSTEIHNKLKLNSKRDISSLASVASERSTWKRKEGDSTITGTLGPNAVSSDYTYFAKVGCYLADGASFDDLKKYEGTPSDHRLLVDGVQKEVISIEQYDSANTDSKADYYITFEVGSPKRYDINVNGGKAYVGDAADNPRTDSYAGLNFTLSADAPEGCNEFKGWKTEGVTVADPSASKTTFVMPADNIKIEAVFEAAEPDFAGAERTYTWTGDSCTATVNCTKCNGVAGGTHAVSETVTGTYVKDTDATCTAAETGHYEATFINTLFVKQSTAAGSVTKGSALGHTYGAPVYTWSEDSCTAKAVCTNAGCTDNVTETKAGTYVKDTDATCTVAETGHYEVTFENALFAKQSTAAGSVTKGSALGHSYGAPVYTWSEDSCTAKAVCAGCTDAVTETETGTYIKDTDAFCTAAETGHYEVTFENALFAKQITATGSVTKGSALGHKDADNNGKCDVCKADIPGYVAPTPAPTSGEESPIIVIGGGESTVPTESGSTIGESTVPTTGGTTTGESTVPTESGSTTGESTVPTTGGTTTGGTTTGESSVPTTGGTTTGETTVPTTESGTTTGGEATETKTPETTKSEETTTPVEKPATKSEVKKALAEAFTENKVAFTEKEVSDAVAATKKDSAYYDESGKKITSSFIETSDGKLRYVGTTGKSVKKAVVASYDAKTGEAKMYYAGKTGVIVKNKVVTLPDGSKIFASKDGSLATNEIVTSGKHQYFAGEDGKLVTNSVVKLEDGRRFYTNKSGYIRKNALVTDPSGYKHYATADGTLAKSCWVTVGDTEYWCNKIGRVTKTRKAE